MNRRYTYEQMDLWLKIIGKSVRGESLDGLFKDNEIVDWEEILSICTINNVSSFVFNSIEHSEIIEKISPEILEDWKQITQYITRRQITVYVQLRKVIEEVGNQLLVFFKGPVLANLYPQYLLRSSSDTDIWVPEEQYLQTEKVLFNLGYLKNEDESKPQVGVYYHSVNKHMIELHIRLWEDYTGKKIDILASMGLTNNESLIELDVCGIKVTTLGHTEHLIYQMFHIIKHFSLQGIGVKYLADISLFIEQYKNQIDWKRFWESMNVLGYTKFCNNFFDICTAYFNMCKVTQEDSRCNWELNDDEKWTFIDDLFRKGVIDEGNASWQIYGAMTPYFTGENNAPKEGWKKKIIILFPSVKSLPNNYGYAKKCPILLPIAWLHRFILFGIHRVTCKSQTYNASQKMMVTQYRLQMMESMGLMEE